MDLIEVMASDKGNLLMASERRRREAGLADDYNQPRKKTIKAFGFDIETIPNMNIVERLPEPKVSLGNTKDPAKVAAKVREAKDKQLENLALSPITGRICSYAVYGDELNQFSVIDKIDDDSEAKIIREAFELIKSTKGSCSLVITWAGDSFDIPFLYSRAAILGIELPGGMVPMETFLKRYSREHHIDMRTALFGYNNYTPLESVTSVLFDEKKEPHDFKRFIELIESGWTEEIGVYNLKDSKLTYRIYETFKRHLFWA